MRRRTSGISNFDLVIGLALTAGLVSVALAIHSSVCCHRKFAEARRDVSTLNAALVVGGETPDSKPAKRRPKRARPAPAAAAATSVAPVLIAPRATEDEDSSPAAVVAQPEEQGPGIDMIAPLDALLDDEPADDRPAPAPETPAAPAEGTSEQPDRP